MLIKTVFLFILILSASYCDLRFKKIFNYLTLPFLIGGVFLNIFSDGLQGLLFSLAGIAAGAAILYFPFSWGWTGGGDLKLLASAGSFVGPLVIAKGALLGFIIFGVIAIFYLLKMRRLQIFLRQLAFFLLYSRSLQSIEVSGTLPLGICLGLAVLFSWIQKQYLC